MTALGLSTPLELLDELKRKVRALNQLQFQVLQLIGALDQQGAAQALGYKDLVEVFKHALRWDPKVSRRKVKQAQALCPSITPTGSLLAPALPGVADAMAAGELSEDHVEVLAEAMAGLPSVAEEHVVAYALQHEPRSAKAFCTELAYRLDQDGPQPREPQPVQPRNSLRRQWKAGRYLLSADLDAETGAKLDALIDPLAKPEPGDLRTAPEREGDALCEVADLALRGSGDRIHGGDRVQLTVTVDYDKLREGIGTALLDNGDRLPMSRVRRIACDAAVIPAVLGSRSQIYDVGRKTRTINAGLRRVLVARDKGCAFPGCTRPPKHCEAHHIKFWADGGETNAANLVLLCRRHHDLAHHSQWQIQMLEGRPAFRPPAFIDPLRRPRTNEIRAA
ncbi:HNH endonuclease signature motif containing protein [Lentzea sp. NBRC 102530]|uniref:HNH endonuclease signature motif containing protein n=1 Tax=Lentzea sp. NBRC 102530 TaxID=3032201 RepID=UPI0024A1E951|nr:HNH endonuclease signature motif containing protein [Lentzea sp. NBRC 102530]GLY48792.1 HNH endonuclease [Lentzea sp. NBRC 102530]